MFKKTYIVTQMILVKKEHIGNSIHNSWEVLVRKVKADSVDEALNMFINGTSHICVEAAERLNPNAYLVSNLIEL